MNNRLALGAAVAIVVVAALGIAIAFSSDDGEQKASATTGSTSTTVATIKPAPLPPGWEPTPIPECVDPVGTIEIIDLATKEPISLDRKRYCDKVAEVTTLPTCRIDGAVLVSNGRLVVQYHEMIHTRSGNTEFVTQGRRIPYEEAQTILAEEERCRST